MRGLLIHHCNGDNHADEPVTMHSEATLDDVLTDILATRSRTRPRCTCRGCRPPNAGARGTCCGSRALTCWNQALFVAGVVPQARRTWPVPGSGFDISRVTAPLLPR